MDEDSARAIIFGNTKRHKRTVDLLTIAECFKFLENVYGNQEKVAQRTDLSREMVREFLQVLTLPPFAKDLIRSRKIDSIDIAYRLSRVKDETSLKNIINKIENLQSHDIRDIIRAIEENSGLSVDSAATLVIKDIPKNVHVFVVDFSDETYRRLVLAARKSNCSPADLLKTITEEWFDKKDEEDSVK